jgi:murein DD-endopeptidase MepM/ murein hydrolase activator NlpD
MEAKIMKYYKSKTAKFFRGNGFFLILALCMVAIGFAAYSVFDAVRLDDSQKEASEIRQEIKTEIKEEQTETEEEQTPVVTPTETETAEKYFVSPLKNGATAKPWSNDTLQYSLTLGDMRIHLGADIVPLDDLSVYSVFGGVVLAVDTNTEFGNVVSVDHADGIVVRYCGLTAITVKAGDSITAGQKLGEVGIVTNECADEEHLHIEVLKDGIQINPASILPID